jgi:hypothetical protein
MRLERELEREPKYKHSLFKCKTSDERFTCTCESKGACLFWDKGCWRWSVVTDEVSQDKMGFIDRVPELHDGHRVLKVRERLSSISKPVGPKWAVPAAEAAISLSKAIGDIMNSLHPPPASRDEKKFWCMPVCVCDGRNAGKCKCKERVYFRLQIDETGRWKPCDKEIGAFLSLWLFELSTRTNDLSAAGSDYSSCLRRVGTWTPDLQDHLQRWGSQEARIMLKIAEEVHDDGEGRKGETSWKSENFSRKTVFGFNATTTNTPKRRFRTMLLQDFVREGGGAAKKDSELHIVLSFEASLPTICAHELLSRFLQTALSDGGFTRRGGR